MKDQTVEVVLFQLAEGVTEPDFLDTAVALEEWLQQVDGFQRRELSRDEAGNWLDIVYWDSLSQAQQAAAQIMATSVGQRFGRKIASDTIQMFHMHPAHRFQIPQK